MFFFSRGRLKKTSTEHVTLTSKPEIASLLAQHLYIRYESSKGQQKRYQYTRGFPKKHQKPHIEKKRGNITTQSKVALQNFPPQTSSSPPWKIVPTLSNKVVWRCLLALPPAFWEYHTLFCRINNFPNF